MRCVYAALILMLLFLGACAMNDNKEILHYEQSAVKAIDKALQDLKLPSKLAEIISNTDMITIGSIEFHSTKDINIIATVEDALIKQFVQAGYKVLERDYDMLYKNMLDSGKLNGSSFTVNIQEDAVPGYAISKTGGFELTPATKTIAYRIEELGIAYIPIRDKDKEYIRQARVILNVRVENPVTNQILFVDTFEGISEDSESGVKLKALEKIHYHYHPRAYPASYLKNEGSNVLMIIQEDKEQERRPGCAGGS